MNLLEKISVVKGLRDMKRKVDKNVKILKSWEAPEYTKRDTEEISEEAKVLITNGGEET